MVLKEIESLLEHITDWSEKMSTLRSVQEFGYKNRYKLLCVVTVLSFASKIIKEGAIFFINLAITTYKLDIIKCYLAEILC